MAVSNSNRSLLFISCLLLSFHWCLARWLQLGSHCRKTHWPLRCSCYNVRFQTWLFVWERPKLSCKPPVLQPVDSRRTWPALYQGLQPQVLANPRIDLRISLNTTSTVLWVPGKEGCSFLLPTHSRTLSALANLQASLSLSFVSTYKIWSSQ